MSPSDKVRRGPGSAATEAAALHVYRGRGPSRDAPSSSSSSSSSFSSSSSSTMTTTTTNTMTTNTTTTMPSTSAVAPALARKDVIAPPPRVQLTSSSPSPEDQTFRAPAKGSSSTTSGAARSRSRSKAPSTVEDKDACIASLERELHGMRADFARDLDKLSASESETASFWQAKHTALNQHFMRADAELRLLRDEMHAREAGAEDAVRALRDAMRLEVVARDDEIRELRAQVRGLKEWVSTSTRADGTVSTSDEVFVEGWARLGNGLQNWVISNFRRAKVDLSRADEDMLRELAGFVPMCEELARSAKVHLLQSVVSGILAQRIFGAYFVGLTAEQEDQLRRTEDLMASFGSVESVSQWRSVTLSVLKKEAAGRMEAQTTQTTEDVICLVNRILGAITTDATASSSSSSSGILNGSTTTPGAEARDHALRQLVSSAIELARLLVVQKAALEVWTPQIVPYQQTIFDHVTMEDIGGEDEESLVQREICCVTFPGIIKRGDENGAHFQFRNVISKARVLCSPE